MQSLKFLSFLSILCLFIVACSSTKFAKSPNEIKEIVYLLELDDLKEELRLTNIVYNDQGISFDYTRNGTKKSYSVNQEAKEKAIKLHDITSATSSSDEDETFIFLSDKVHKGFTRSRTTPIDIGDGKETLLSYRKEPVMVSINGKLKSLESYYGYTVFGNKFWILNYNKIPILLKCEANYKLKIQSISTK